MPIFQEYASLKHLNTFGIEAKARYFTAIQDVTQFSALLSQPLFQQVPKFILGGGSNILLTQDFAGLIIKNDIKGIRHLTEDEHHISIEVGAGENWHDFVMYCVARGFAGIENLSLIPGTIGAAPIQNIGAYGVELCDVFIELNALDLRTGKTQIFTKEECQFDYRDSIFKNHYKDTFIILSVTFQLNKQPIFHVNYGNIQETLEKMQVTELSIKAISDAIIDIRRNKLPDPKDLGNAGSFFKNPIISATHFLALQQRFPKIPYFSTENPDTIKIPAGWLIEQCGWKGKRFGDIGIYEKQALIIVNFGKGRGEEIQALAQKIQQSVHNEFSITLTPEVNFI
jgi:UDP-N-acetylmuramate dehydrogenase